MSEQNDSPKKPRPVSGRTAKKRKFYLLQVGPDEWYRLRRADLPTIFFEGLFPSPLLRAVDSLQQMRNKIANENFADALQSVTPEMRSTFMEILRRAAVAIVVEPRLTHSKAASLRDPDLLWVGGYSDIPEEQNVPQPQEESGDVPISILMQVWRALLNEGGIVVMPDDDATEFRASEPSVPLSPVPDGSGVRAEAVVVDPAEPALVGTGGDAGAARSIRFVAHE